MPSQTRFGHHPDPATDFEIEVESLESIVTDKSLGLRTDEPWPVERIRKAMEFRVGGVESCVTAKQALRRLEEKVSDATKPSQTSSQGSEGEVGASPADAEFVGLYMLGRCANGAERDKGVLIHAVPRQGWRALCGKAPGKRSAGWAGHPTQAHPVADVNCPRCSKKLPAQAISKALGQHLGGEGL